jgi:hypothetical protein
VFIKLNQGVLLHKFNSETKLMKQMSGWLGGTGLEEWRKRMLDGVEKQEHTKLNEE